ncbi:MAG: hypothetical protein UIG59_09190 [Acutalibacteraceae bacterium]|nr:hypothetical protein [Acutalibacteraceae bacterium]
MKLKHVLWIFTGIVAVIGLSVGVAVLVDRFINRKECPDGYIECETSEIEDTEE